MKSLVAPSAPRARLPRPSLLQASLRLALAGLPLLTPALSQAQAAPQQQAAARAYDIPAGPLAEALSRFGAASGLLISVDARLTEQRQSPGLRGAYGPDEGLHALLAGTGLMAQRTPQGNLTLVPAPQPGKGALQLAPLRVQGEAAAQGLALHASPQEEALAPYREARSINQIDRETLERFRGTSPGEMLKGVPGVQMGDLRNGHSLDVNIRGLQGQGRVAVVVDGSQQSLDVYRGYAGQQQRSYLDPDLIGSVTIDKGPSLSLDGAGAIAGVVSMRTLQARDILADGASSGWRLRGGLADNSVREQSGFKIFNRSNRNDITDPASGFASAAYALRGERFDLVAAIVHRQQGNYFAGKHGAERYVGNAKSGGSGTGYNPDDVYKYYRPGEEVLNTHSRSDSLLLKGSYRHDADQTLELGLRRMKSRYGEVMPSAIMRTPASSQWVTYADPENTMQQFEPGRMDLTALTAEHRWQPAGQSLIDLKSKLWFTRADSLMFNGVVSNTPVGRDLPSNQLGDPQGDTYQHALRSDVRGQRWGAQLGNSSLFFFDGGQSLKAEYGLSYTHEKTGPGAGAKVVESDLRANRYVRSGLRKEASLTGSLEWKPAEAWSLLAGGRLLQYSVQDNNRQAHVTARTKVPRRAVYLYKDGKALDYVTWYPDAKGQFTEDSLRNSPHLLGTMADLGYDSWKPLGPNNGAFMDEIPSAWRFDEPLRRKGTRFAPTFSASFKPDEQSLIYVRYATGFKLPSMFESTVGNSFITPNPHLKPEQNRSLELGAATTRRDVWQSGDRLSLKLARFENRVKDYITRSYDPAEYSFTMSNMDRFETAGWELQSAYEGGAFFVEASASYFERARTCDAATGAALRNAKYGVKNAPDCADGGFGGSYANTQNPPKFSINTTLGLRLLEDKRLTLGARLVRNSAPLHRLDKPWNTNAYTTVQQYYAATRIVDLFVSYKLQPQAELSLALDNVGNRYYLDALALSPMPAPGRTLRADFSWRF
ncbi:TonB-dependent receptor [Roseateles sp. DAIF2]|uniref:TonB-dependent receptor n=1 Tax=Roseateles sp. DAIF2 TaxID=2714952 RepID=UPI0018A303E9|nr:TonB-dependent receptor [Roseateles sp. DAIF2]QPF75403.1 TonB-dependent receptor [Roseateles sp. DAIF2]